MSSTSPLIETARRLSGLSEYLDYHVGIPDEQGWHRLAELSDPGLLTAWHRELTHREGDRRTAAAYLGGWVATAAVEALLLPVLADGCLPLSPVDNVAVHRHDDGWFDGVAVPGAPVAVLVDDFRVPQGGVEVVVERESLLALVAQRVLGIGAVFATIHADCPIGLPALWGGLADAVAAQALWLARLLDADREAAWRDAHTIIERLAGAQPLLRQRPQRFPVDYSGGQELFKVSGTCCLYYRTIEAPDADGDGYCATCPLRTDTSRTRRLRAHLEDQIAS